MQILRYEYLATDSHLVNSIRLCQPETNFHCLFVLNSTPDLFNRGILADVIVYIFPHLHRALRTEGKVLDLN